ncbi:MAG: DNA adenine methylase [Prevotella sp.]|jgi:DNA adenine methylase|nr:DNA adenine methylase [Prevotella sp.]
MSIEAKPFLKWAGGKGQLLSQLSEHLPKRISKEPFTYIEPFVGGGAMLFYMLQHFGNIKKAVINDVNEDLILTYRIIKDDVETLIANLDRLEKDYLSITDQNGRSQIFYDVRERYNQRIGDSVERASQLVFLNKTCFNGLYRVNRRGQFNVPFGKYANPTICNAKLLRADSQILQSAQVEICQGDYVQTMQHLDGLTFVYLDPPYRPLDATSSFTAYAKGDFNDDDQRALAGFCHQLNDAGCYWMESNADCSAKNPEDTFFEELYKDYRIERVYASRFINANPEKRGKLTELLIKNYE